jgi:hypothetical protein
LPFLATVACTRWGPELATDPAYRSGRASVCTEESFVGEPIPFELDESDLRPSSRGFERTSVYTFEAAPSAGGSIRVCSEYGFVRVIGVDGTRGRVAITVSCPFPGGVTRSTTRASRPN